MTDPIANQINRYMDLLSYRQKLVAGNIANADTPNYKTQDVDFASELRSLSNAPGAAPTSKQATGLQSKTDGNNVSVDREARLLAENALRFNMAASLMKAQLRQIRSAIQEGR